MTVAAAVLAPRLLPRHVVLDVAPDRPRPFGSEMSWLAIKTDDVPRLVEFLELEDARPANWNSGIGAIYDTDLSDAFVFVAPPIKGWTLVAGVALPLPAGGSFIDKAAPLVERLSKEFGTADYFASFPIIDFFAWARFERGRPVRAFAIGEAGLVWDAGRLTRPERRLGLTMIELRGIRDRHGDMGGSLHLHPTEPHVLSIAGSWSLNPMMMERLGKNPGVGLIARAPHAWRAERLRKVA